MFEFIFFTVLSFFYFQAYRFFMPFFSVVLSFALIAFCFPPHYAFIIVLFYHVIVSFVVGCLGRVSCLLRRRLFSVFGLCSLVFSLFEAFIFDFIYYQ